MFGRSITLFKLFDFAIRIDRSWLVILVLVIWSLAGGVFPAAFGGLTWPVYLVMGVIGAFGLFASVVFHELSHSLVARRYGMKMKGITLFIFGGVAEMGDEPPTPKAEFWMAIAGPMASVGLCGFFYGLALLGDAASAPAPAAGVARWLGLMNGMLAAFNMLPGFPLDGGRVLRSILWHVQRNLRKATFVASTVGTGLGLALILLGLANLLMLNPIGGIWWILIGMFVRSAARQGYQQVLLRGALQGLPVRNVMKALPVTVSPSTPVKELVENYFYKYRDQMFPVLEQGRLVGCVSTKDVRILPPGQWERHTVADIVQPCSIENMTTPDGDAFAALASMTRNNITQMSVVEDGRLVGTVALKDLMRFLSLKLELEGDDRSLTRHKPAA